MNVDLIIPALDEELSIENVLLQIPKEYVRRIIVVDNGSKDSTKEIALKQGAEVLEELEKGYGKACLKGLSALDESCDIVVFLDADGSDDPTILPFLLKPIQENKYDFVVASRTIAKIEKGALSLQQKIGNKIASYWLKKRFGLPVTDLGPFRAIRYTSLMRLNMVDRNFGWTVEMQIKAAIHKLKYTEISAPYKKRKGYSKISGTFLGVLGATYKILGWLFIYDIKNSIKR